MEKSSIAESCAPALFEDIRMFDVITALSVGITLSSISLLAFLVFQWHYRKRLKKVEKLKQNTELTTFIIDNVQNQAGGAQLILSVFNHLGSKENRAKNLLIDAHVVGELMKLLKARSKNQTIFAAENPELERIICQLEKREILEKKMAGLNQKTDKPNEEMVVLEAVSSI